MTYYRTERSFLSGRTEVTEMVVRAMRGATPSNSDQEIYRSSKLTRAECEQDVEQWCKENEIDALDPQELSEHVDYLREQRAIGAAA